MATTTASRPGLRRHWPVVAAVAFAALIAAGLAEGADLAGVLAASAAVYLGAAALGRPAAAWPLFLGTVVVITAARIAAVEPTWAILVLAAAVVPYGLLRGRARPTYGLPLQLAAMAAFGAAAALALGLDPHWGSYLVAAGLIGHAGWDAFHHRTGRVVSRSLAEFCLVLDLALAAAIIAVTIAD